MQYFFVKEDKSPQFTGVVAATHQWGLPGIRRCPTCTSTWAAGCEAYPSVDLGPIASLEDFEEARAEPLEEYERLAELVRPLFPPGAVPEPGTEFGPLVGKAHGRFGSLVFAIDWWLLVQREPLEKLQAEGLHGLKGCPTRLTFRQRQPPELLELEVLPAGHLHAESPPIRRGPICSRCGRDPITFPKVHVLDAQSVPENLDLFRLADFPAYILCTERFADACQRLNLDGAVFRPFPAR